MRAALGARVKAFVDDTRLALAESPGLKLVLFTTVLTAFLAGLLIPVLPLFLIDRGFSLLQLGGLFSLVAASAVLVQVLSGRYHAFFGRREVVLALLSVGVLVYPTYIFLETPLQFLVVTALSSFAAAASAPGLQLLIAESAPLKRRAHIFAYFGVISSLSYAAAIVVGFYLSAIGYAFVIYLGTLVSLLSFLVMLGLALNRRLAARAEAAKHTDDDTREALAESSAALDALRDWQVTLFRARSGLEGLLPRPKQAGRNVQWLTLHLFFFGISVAVYPVYFPLYLDQLGLPRVWGGLVIASSWVTFGLCQPLGARWAERTGKHRQLIVVSLVVAAFFNLIMATQSLLWVVVAWVLLGIADGIGRPVTSALVVSSVTRAGRGAAFGWTAAGTTAARVVAPYALAFAIAGGGGIAGALLLVTLTIVLAALPVAFVRTLDEPAVLQRPAAAGGVA